MKKIVVLLIGFIHGILMGGQNSPRTLYVENSLGRTLSLMTLDDQRIHQDVLVLGQVPNQVLACREQLLVLNSVPAEIMVIDGKTRTMEKRIALPEGSNPYTMALAGAQRVYVTLLVANAVAVVNLSSGVVETMIPVGVAPQGILIDRNIALVANTGGWPDYRAASISILNIATSEEWLRLPVPANPQVVRPGPDFRYYVLCSGSWGMNSGCLAVIDPYAPPNYTAPAVVDTIAVGGYPGDLAVLPDGTAWMSDWGDAANGFLYQLNIFTGQVLADASNPLRIGRGAMRFLWDKKMGELYVSNFDQDTIQKISPSDGKVLATYPMGDGAQDLAIVESIETTDPWADEVISFTPGDPWLRAGYDFFPFNVLGPPDPDNAINERLAASSPQEVLSLGHGGSITLKFTDNLIVDGPGTDFIVFENVFVNMWTGGPFIEAGMVAVSQDGERFYTFPWDTASLRGLAGVSPVKSTSHPTDPILSGGDAFDLGEAGLEWARYVRITDLGDLWKEGPYNGDFDLDAVVAVNSAAGNPEPFGNGAVQPINYPNPFNQGTTLHFSLPTDRQVLIRIYSAIGRLVRTVNLGYLSAGAKVVSWDGRAEDGSWVGSGIYFAEIRYGGMKQTVKMTVLN